MKQFVFAFTVLAMVSGASAPISTADTNWLQAGIRPWYFGGTQAVPQENEDPKPSTPIALAFLIRGIQGEAVNMTQYSWSPSMASTSWVGFTSGPAGTLTLDEGPFWALPSRLQPLQPGATTPWQGKVRTVSERGQIAADKMPLALLPTRAMFQLTPQRDMLWLKFKTNEQNRVEDTLFDVETGLVLYHGAYDDKNRMYLCLAELNYDFAAKRGFAEEAGPHTSFAGVFGAATLGAGAFQFFSQVQTRYKDEVVVNIISILTGAGSQMSMKNHLLYFNGRGEARMVEVAAAPSPLEQWQSCGDHNFWWVPPADLTASQITAWATPLYRAGLINNRTTFSTRDAPADPGLRALTFDSRGFLADLAVLNKQLGINVDTAGPCYNRTLQILGPADYAGMTRAAPPGRYAPGRTATATNPVPLVFGQLLQNAPARPSVPNRDRPATAGTGLDALRGEYERLRADMEKAGRQRIGLSTNIAEQAVQGRILREQIRLLDKHYMDMLDRMQKDTSSLPVHNAIESEKLRVWRILDGLDRQ